MNTTVDLAAIEAWTAQNERARDAYYADPFAATRCMDGTAGPCSRCRHGSHRQCPGHAVHGGHLVICSCWLDDHPRGEGWGVGAWRLGLTDAECRNYHNAYLRGDRAKATVAGYREFERRKTTKRRHYREGTAR